MAALRVGINGFGRIGRLALRAGFSRSELEFVAINEPASRAEDLALLLEFDSLHGRFEHPCVAHAGGLRVDRDALALSAFSEPERIDWAHHGVEQVMAWYDHEWGYVNRMIDLACAIAQAA